MYRLTTRTNALEYVNRDVNDLDTVEIQERMDLMIDYATNYINGKLNYEAVQESTKTIKFVNRGRGDLIKLPEFITAVPSEIKINGIELEQNDDNEVYFLTHTSAYDSSPYIQLTNRVLENDDLIEITGHFGLLNKGINDVVLEGSDIQEATNIIFGLILENEDWNTTAWRGGDESRNMLANTFKTPMRVQEIINKYRVDKI